MNQFSLLLKIVSCLVQYGPPLWKLGVEVYKIVDQIIDKFKRENPAATPVEVKALADTTFDVKVVEVARKAAMRVPAPVTVTQLRRDVWSTRPENYRKVVLGRKPT